MAKIRNTLSFSHSGIRGTFKRDTQMIDWDGKQYPLSEARPWMREKIQAVIDRTDGAAKPVQDQWVLRWFDAEDHEKRYSDWRDLNDALKRLVVAGMKVEVSNV
jgi:hypothetical protein